MEDDIINELKPFINASKLYALQEKWAEYQETDFGRDIAWDYVFQKIYLHACLKKQTKIVEWLMEMYTLFNPVTQIAIRQVFHYGEFLLRSKQHYL